MLNEEPDFDIASVTFLERPSASRSSWRWFVRREAIEQSRAACRGELRAAAADGVMCAVPRDADASRVAIGMADLRAARIPRVGPVATGSVERVAAECTAVRLGAGEHIMTHFGLVLARDTIPPLRQRVSLTDEVAGPRERDRVPVEMSQVLGDSDAAHVEPWAVTYPVTRIHARHAAGRLRAQVGAPASSRQFPLPSEESTVRVCTIQSAEIAAVHAAARDEEAGRSLWSVDEGRDRACDRHVAAGGTQQEKERHESRCEGVELDGAHLVCSSI